MSKWSIPIDRLAKKAGEDIEKVGRFATFQLFNAVQLRSPVDTGRFRGNWQFGKDTIPQGALNRLDTTGSLAQTEAQKAMTSPLGGVAYFVNNLPYARRLENGYSQQAPVGMVRVSVREFSKYVREATR
jgi:hypothetical protein